MTYQTTLKAPFPYFGGKREIATLVWQALGDVPNYVEPFCGSLAVLLARPHPARIETVNDKDGFVSNFWRALYSDPGAVAHYADWPVCENDLHARHAWMVGQRESMQEQLEGDPWWYDARIAGWWVWCMSLWIGSKFCSGDGPWSVHEGRLVKSEHASDGIQRKRPHFGNAGRGIHRQLPHFGNAGVGIHRQLLSLGDRGRELQRHQNVHDYLCQLADRLRQGQFRCASGEWLRVCTPSVTVHNGPTGVFLDPPYSHRVGRDTSLYRVEEDVTAAVLGWCRRWGHHPLLRIVLCGYDEYVSLDDHGWRQHAWKARGGYGSQSNGKGRVNASRERIWLSPYCRPVDAWQQQELFSP